MIAEAFIGLCQRSQLVRKFLWKQWDGFLGGYFRKKTDWKFMNYGYASSDPHAPVLPLFPDDESDRYPIQLYHYLLTLLGSDQNIETLDVLEIGSGRGGGCVFMKNYLNPKTVVGIDFAMKTVAFCNRNFQMPGLIFVTGDAELLPFDDQRFDVVVNVESSHCYQSMEIFTGEAKYFAFVLTKH